MEVTRIRSMLLDTRKLLVDIVLASSTAARKEPQRATNRKSAGLLSSRKRKVVLLCQWSFKLVVNCTPDGRSFKLARSSGR